MGVDDNAGLQELSNITQPVSVGPQYILVSNHIQDTSKECTKCAAYQEAENSRRKAFEELIAAYHKCKASMKEFITKYRSLVVHDEPLAKRQKISSESDDIDGKEECQCTLNKKIVYDDDGNEVKVDNTLENHICPRKRKLSKQIQIAQNDEEIELSNDFKVLTETLKDPHLPALHRYKVLDKVKVMRQDYMNQIKFEKRALVEQLKANPDAVLRFKGTNLSSIPGYS